MLKTLKNNLNKLISFLVVLTLGILVGFYILAWSLNQYILSKEIFFQIDPINTLSIFINVLLVVYVTRTLNRKN